MLGTKMSSQMNAIPPRPDLGRLAVAEATIASWSAGDALLMFMAAIGALTLEQILLFVLHFPTGRLYATIWTIGASVLLLSVAVIGARRFGRPGAASALRIRWPRPLDIAVGIPLGIALYYITIWLQQLINNHFSSWVS